MFGPADLSTLQETDTGIRARVPPQQLDAVRARLPAQRLQALRRRIADEVTTTFESRYRRHVTLRELLSPAVIAASARRATGEKYLILPQENSAPQG